MVDTPRPPFAMFKSVLKSTFKGELPALLRFMSDAGMGDSSTVLLNQTRLGYENIIEKKNSEGNSIREIITPDYLSVDEIIKKMNFPDGDSGRVKRFAWNFVNRSLHIFSNAGVLKRKMVDMEWKFKFNKPWGNVPDEKRLERARKTNDSIIQVSSILIPKSMQSLEKGTPYTKYDDKVYSLLWDNMLRDPVLLAQRKDLAELMIKKQKKFIQKSNKLNIVDLGSGVGAGTIDILRILIEKGINADITLIEEAKSLLGVSEKNINEFMDDNKDTIENKGVEYDFHYINSSIGMDDIYMEGFENDIDTVFMSQLIHYLPYDADVRLIEEISKHVVNKGILGVANAYSYSNTYFFPPEFMLWNTESFRGFPYLPEIKEIMRAGFQNVKEYRIGYVHLGYKRK